MLYHLGLQLCHELLNDNPLGGLYADSIITTLTLYLLRHYSSAPILQNVWKGTLNQAQLCRIDEYIYALLDEKISLVDLAHGVHISVPHFERMFRATMQQPPYRYVLDVRLEKAKTFLKSTRLSLVDIALQCGFGSQSHFTTHFSRRFGITPAHFGAGLGKG